LTVPPGSGEVVVIVGGEGGWITIARACLACCPPLSAIWTVNDDVPEAVGVPEITPVAGSRFRFCGSVPVTMLQLSGGVPPMAFTGWLYAWPTNPSGSEVVVVDSGGGIGLIVKVRDF